MIGSLSRALALSSALAFGATPAPSAETTLYTFAGGRDGANPFGGLTSDSVGNLYGTTESGGKGAKCGDGAEGCGTVFELPANGSETILHAFSGGGDGSDPIGRLIIDSAGNLYGTATDGGSADNGTVFKVSPGGSQTVLHTFQGGSDGAFPYGGLVVDKRGNLYGTTNAGGNSLCNGAGCGTVFEVTAGGKEKVLYAFQGGSDGAGPFAALVRDANGNLFGTTYGGGTGSACQNFGLGCGTVFKIAANGTESVLYSFLGGSDGALPTGPLLHDKSDYLYGTTPQGGTGYGTVFRLAPDGTQTVLHAFGGGKDGAFPLSGLAMDKRGNLYGTTYSGGAERGRGCGTVFEVTPGQREKIVYAFHRLSGCHSRSELLLGAHGEIYGTTLFGGTGCRRGCGVVFAFSHKSPSPDEKK